MTVVKIRWEVMSPKVQAHGRCRYCERPAHYMKPVQRGRASRTHYVALCDHHAQR